MRMERFLSEPFWLRALVAKRTKLAFSCAGIELSDVRPTIA